MKHDALVLRARLDARSICKLIHPTVPPSTADVERITDIIVKVAEDYTQDMQQRVQREMSSARARLGRLSKGRRR